MAQPGKAVGSAETSKASSDDDDFHSGEAAVPGIALDWFVGDFSYLDSLANGTNFTSDAVSPT
jgi:hypothetical protein